MSSAAEVQAFMAAHDEAMRQRVERARANGCTPRYVATITTSDMITATIALKDVPLTHPFASLAGSSIAVCICTEDHPAEPLVISGAISKTSCVNALYSDVLRLSRTLDPRARDKGPLAKRSSLEPTSAAV